MLIIPFWLDQSSDYLSNGFCAVSCNFERGFRKDSSATIDAVLDDSRRKEPPNFAKFLQHPTFARQPASGMLKEDFLQNPTKNHWNRATLAAWKARSNLKVRPEFGFKTYAGHFGIKVQTTFGN